MNKLLIEIMTRWLSTGHILPDDLALLKVQYLIDVGAPPGCKTCANVWEDIKVHFYSKLKALNLLTPVANSTRKYLIIGASFLMLPGFSELIVNEGEETEDRKVLTDEMAEAILAKYPSYDKLIGINPAWVDPNAEDEPSEDSDKSDELKPVGDTALSALQAKYDALLADYEKLKNDHSVQKGLLTKANNALAKVKATPLVSDPAPAVATNEPTVPTVDTTPAGDASSTDSNGNPAADAAQAAIDAAQA